MIFVSGYLGSQEGKLTNDIRMLSFWVKASTTRPVTFNNYKFKIIFEER